MGRNETFIQKAEALKPELLREKVACSNVLPMQMKSGDKIVLDFENHQVGYLTLSFVTIGSHFDAPAWLRIKFAERLCELEENAEDYHGWISKGWIQQEQVHIDCFPYDLAMPRRYAFRYVSVEVLDTSNKYTLVLKDAVCDTVSSADDTKLLPYSTQDEQLRELDAIACRTLHSCMQSVFEDGPKRDRRLWMGDLRMQALANYETYRNNDLVKRCLYLFAGTTMEKDKVGACLFLKPQIEVDDTDMFDYALFYIPTLLSYLEATGDMDTAKELYATAVHQLAIAREQMDENGIISDSDRLGWCFVDWNLFLNKQASAQGIYLYCLDAASRLAEALEKAGDAVAFQNELVQLRNAAKTFFWDADRQLFVSGKDRQVSWASQVWMIHGGVLNDADAASLLERIKTVPDAMTMVTPYMYHNYVDALIQIGKKEEALSVLRSYWGSMAAQGADTFWELYDPADPNASPYGGTIVNSYCHAWSCAPAYFLRKYYEG